VNVGLNILLIPRFGMTGAASATAIADVVWFVMSYYYFRRAVLPRESFPSLRGPLIGGVAMAAVLWFTRFMNWPLRAGLSLVVYLLAQVLVGNLNLRLLYQRTSQK
jgi:O-antigen/teichoic acid export membrane protein